MTKKYRLTCLNPECDNIGRTFERRYCCLACAEYSDDFINYNTWLVLYHRRRLGFKNTMFDNIIFFKEDDNV